MVVRLMKYLVIVAVASVSLLIAIPITEYQTLQQPSSAHLRLVSQKGSIKAAEKTTVKVSNPQPLKPKPTPVPTPAPQPENQQSNSAPATTPQSPNTVTLASYQCESYKSLFEQYSWNVATAMAICQAESGGNPSAVSNASINPDGIPDYGLMQLHGIDILDPAQNIAYAYYHKYLTQGWHAWSTYTSGRYLHFE